MVVLQIFTFFNLIKAVGKMSYFSVWFKVIIVYRNFYVQTIMAKSHLSVPLTNGFMRVIVQMAKGINKYNVCLSSHQPFGEKRNNSQPPYYYIYHQSIMLMRLTKARKKPSSFQT